MGYYKVYVDNEFVGVGADYDFRCFQKKHRIIIGCDKDVAQFIQIDEDFYHDEWMLPCEDDVEYIIAKVEETDETTYTALLNAKEVHDQFEPQIVDSREDEEVDQPPSVDLEYVRMNKILDMNDKCYESITDGINVKLSDGAIHHFSLSLENQMRIAALAVKAEKGIDNLPWHADGEESTFYGANDIIAINDAMERLITYHLTYFNNLKYYINQLDDIGFIDGIQYGDEIPTEYQSEVLKQISKDWG